MNTLLVVLGFVVIAVMRVVQKVCSKKVSMTLDSNIKFFHYGGYYQLVAALLALILLAITGFEGFNLPTFLCALACAVLFAVDLFTGIEAMKGTTLVVCNLFAMGGLFIPCVLGIFMFDEPMGIWQWIGIAVFFISIYFISYKKAEKNEDGTVDKETKKPFSLKTLIMLIISFIANGLVMLVQKIFGDAKYVENGNVAMFSTLTFGLAAVIWFICMFVCYMMKSKERTPEGVRVHKIEPLSKKLLIYGALLAVAVFAINQIVTTMGATVSSAVLFPITSAITIIITCLVGTFVFKEKLNLFNIIGIVLATAAIIVVNF